MYCDKCKLIVNEKKCPKCKNEKLRELKDDDLCFLIDIEITWAEMLKEVLENNNIPYTYTKVLGAALAFKMGPLNERYKIYVPYKYFDHAKDIVNSLFNNI